jgi:hypothetical protein
MVAAQPAILESMNDRNISRRHARRVPHSIWLRLVGFVWLFSAALLVAVGSTLGLLGVGGHLLVRARPDTSNVINYDPSTIASFAPLPFGLGCVLIVWFVIRMRSSDR